MSNQNQSATPAYSTALTKISNTYFPMIEQQLTGNGLNMDHYAKQCVMSAISSINAVLDTKGIKWTDEQLDKSNVTQTLLTVASLKLNAAANPREVYFQMRSVKKKVNGKDVWTKQIELGIEGDGNDAILSNFGRGIDTVHQYWLVRSEDEFEYPAYRGIDVEPPVWRPTGKGEVVRVVYPITKTNGQVEYYITEREDVSRNLIAHINNNLMNETFGIAKSRFDATPAQKKQIDEKKREFLNKVKELGLNALDDEEIQQHISPAWKDPQSRESMLIRKMRNNIVKKIPKDFGNAFVEMTYSESEDENLARHRREVNENANQELIDVQYEESPSSEESEPSEAPNNQDPEIIDVAEEPKEEPKKEKQADLFETPANGPDW
ncbi:hypothetical protein J14TS2_16450 [Bacillus sp. J14TS2]|uniref:hypothetical protein n=1 Tax=Bacillus sp. J14TS2 TaxID=2807188 RepID=UPI001B09BCE8|nr:hypothetical protein [Bacillus sp. J14TS2]GIN71170.1 hypothetical protein J14TS2_16450 [Bacillus sp. J14TS2]